jgi:hypothetical protein
VPVCRARSSTFFTTLSNAASAFSDRLPSVVVGSIIWCLRDVSEDSSQPVRLSDFRLAVVCPSIRTGGSSDESYSHHASSTERYNPKKFLSPAV